MGFNPMQPGRVKWADIAMFLFGLLLLGAALAWVLLG
jgi:hypothetical protein